ncbi:MAG: Lpg1974 family pore-forming outer membrane protein [Parachlamydiales bacterium]
MNKWLLFLTLALVPLAAQPFSCGKIEVGGSALYLRPTGCEFPYAITDGRPFVDWQRDDARLPQGNHREIDPDYAWGFRVLLGYQWDCSDLRLLYSRLHSEDTGEQSAPFWPSLAHPLYQGLVSSAAGTFAQSPLFPEGRVRSRVDFEYDAIDLEYAQRSCRGQCLKLRSYIGLHLADILLRFRADYSGVLGPDDPITATATTSTRCKQCSWGIGPIVGTEGRYGIGRGFELVGKGALGVLAGKRDGNIFSQDVREWMGMDAPEDVNAMLLFHMEERNIVVPVIRVAFGIDYPFCLCRLPGVLELAYEYSTYINALQILHFNDRRGTSVAECQSFNLNGLTLSLRVIL